MRFFRPKRRQDAKTPQIAAEDGVGPGPVGEDLGGGSPDLRRQEPLSQELGRKKGSGDRGPETCKYLSHTPTPVGRRIEEGCALVPPRQLIRTSGGWRGGLGEGLGRSWGALDRILGASWDVLASWGGFEPSLVAS